MKSNDQATGTVNVPKSASQSGPAPLPVLHVTPFERVSSGLIAAIAALVAVTSLLAFAWYASRTPPEPPAIPVELVEYPGGVEDGSLDETLRVDSPLPEIPDASPGEVVADESEVAQSLENVVELAADAAANQEVALVQTDRTFGLGTRNAGKPGSASGTGRRALGSGPGIRGFPREQRWFVRFSDQQDLDEYARQLDFFGIELGAIVNNRLVYLSKLSSGRPQVRTVDSGGDEKRLYMTWQGGGRKQADLQLFRKAAIEVGSGAIFHFYPKPTEDQFARLELEFKQRKASDIRRTYFAVNSAGKGYEFAVVRQTLLR